MCQNSGLGNCLNVIASLHQIYEIPVLLVISWRGKGGKDAPEHLVMGDVLPRLLELFHLPFRAPGLETMETDLDWAVATLRETRKPAALVIGAGLFE